MMHGYLFKAYAKRAAPEYIPSMIGTPVNGSSAEPSYYERIEVSDRAVNALSKTQYVVEGTSDPILQVRHPKGSLYYIPKSELEEIAAAHQDDDIFDMLNALFKVRAFG